MTKTLNRNKFLASFNNRVKPHEINKTIQFHGRTIFNVPVIEVAKSFDGDSLSSDTIDKLYDLIQQTPQSEELYFK